MGLGHADYFVVLSGAGAGMALAGGLNALTVRLAAGWRAVLTGAGCGGVLGCVTAITDNMSVVVATAAVMAVGVVPALLAGSASLVELVRRAAALVVRPGVRWGLLAAIGVCTVVGSAAWYDVADAAHTDRDMYELGLDFFRPPLVSTDGAVARTDNGTPVPAKLTSAPRADQAISDAERRFLQSSPFRDQMMRRRKADDGSNCHGWVFTGGQYWLEPGAVALILQENGYVDVTAPRPGDLVIYRANESITHTGVVRYVADEAPVLVEGKWGPMGGSGHPADRCPYGVPTFYRSSRAGHLLAGLTSTDR